MGCGFSALGLAAYWGVGALASLLLIVRRSVEGAKRSINGFVSAECALLRPFVMRARGAQSGTRVVKGQVTPVGGRCVASADTGRRGAARRGLSATDPGPGGQAGQVGHRLLTDCPSPPFELAADPGGQVERRLDADGFSLRRCSQTGRQDRQEGPPV
jgi:hypothetical protein